MTDKTKEELQKTIGKLIDEYNKTQSYWNSLLGEEEKWRKQGLRLTMQMKGEDKSARASLHLHALGIKDELDKVRKKIKGVRFLEMQQERQDKLLSLNQKAKKLGFNYLQKLKISDDGCILLPEEWEK